MEQENNNTISPLCSWIIFYEDGSIFSNVDGKPEDSPPFGVLAIACDDGLWLGGDIFGLTQYLAKPVGYRVVRFGEHVSNRRFHPIVNAARQTGLVSPDRTIMERYDFYWWEGETE